MLENAKYRVGTLPTAMPWLHELDRALRILEGYSVTSQQARLLERPIIDAIARPCARALDPPTAECAVGSRRPVSA